MLSTPRSAGLVGLGAYKEGAGRGDEGYALGVYSGAFRSRGDVLGGKRYGAVFAEVDVKEHNASAAQLVVHHGVVGAAQIGNAGVLAVTHQVRNEVVAHQAQGQGILCARLRGSREQKPKGYDQKPLH